MAIRSKILHIEHLKPHKIPITPPPKKKNPKIKQSKNQTNENKNEKPKKQTTKKKTGQEAKYRSNSLPLNNYSTLQRFFPQFSCNKL